MAKAKRTPLDKFNTLLFGKDLRLPRAGGSEICLPTACGLGMRQILG